MIENLRHSKISACQHSDVVLCSTRKATCSCFRSGARTPEAKRPSRLLSETLLFQLKSMNAEWDRGRKVVATARSHGQRRFSRKRKSDLGKGNNERRVTVIIQERKQPAPTPVSLAGKAADGGRIQLNQDAGRCTAKGSGQRKDIRAKTTR